MHTIHYDYDVSESFTEEEKTVFLEHKKQQFHEAMELHAGQNCKNTTLVYKTLICKSYILKTFTTQLNKDYLIF